MILNNIAAVGAEQGLTRPYAISEPCVDLWS